MCLRLKSHAALRNLLKPGDEQRLLKISKP